MIFRFPIPFNMGHAYCQVLDFSNVSAHYGITVFVYDYFEQIEIDDPEFFKDVPLFMNPIPIVSKPSTRGKEAWKKIGSLKEGFEATIPFYKKYAFEGFAWNTLEEYKSKEWYALANLTAKIGPVPFATVRHLEELFWRSTVTIEKRVAMQLLRYNNVDVVEFFARNSESKSWKVDYNCQQVIPLYRKIPAPIRGKPLIKGFVPDEYLDFDFDSIS
jgi:hypothetical protein